MQKEKYKILLLLRNIILLELLFIFGCTDQPINYEIDLVDKDGVYYKKDSNRPYTGPVFASYDSGSIKEEGDLKDGLLSGGWIYWNQDGNKYSEETYKEGYKEGVFILYRNGQKHREGGYLDRKKHGLFTEWFDNGQKKQEGSFKEGRLSGSWIYWDEEGIMYKEETYKDGKKDGLFI